MRVDHAEWTDASQLECSRMVNTFEIINKILLQTFKRELSHVIEFIFHHLSL